MNALAAQALPPFPSDVPPAPPQRMSLHHVTESPRESLEMSNDSRRSSFAQPRTTSSQSSSTVFDLNRHKSPPSLKRSVTQTSVAMKQSRKSTANLLPNGRMYKVLADLYLLAGRLSDATVWYTTAQNMFRNSQDMVWHASVLEGLATLAVLEAYNGLETKAELPATTGDREPWEELNEKMNLALSLYSKASPSAVFMELEYSLFSTLLCDAALRHANLLFAVWVGKGWTATSLTYMVRPVLPEIFTTRPVPDAHLTALDYAAKGKNSRSHISAALANAHGPFLVHLRPQEKIRVLSSLVSLYSNLGYQRKEAYILRELLSVLLDMIVCGREELRGSITSPTANGVNGNSSPVVERGTVAIRAPESGEGNGSILALVRRICDVYGVPLDVIDLYDDGDDGLQAASTGSDDPQREHFGWPELQVGAVREAMAIAEALPDHVSVAQFAFSALKALQTAMGPADHHHLFTTALKALATAKRRGDERKLEYWAENPILSVEVMPYVVRLALKPSVF